MRYRSLSGSLSVAHARRLFQLLELGIERRLVERDVGGRIHVHLFLDPEIRERHIAVEQFLAVVGVGLEVGRLDFLGEVFEVAGERTLERTSRVCLSAARVVRDRGASILAFQTLLPTGIRFR